MTTTTRHDRLRQTVTTIASHLERVAAQDAHEANIAIARMNSATGEERELFAQIAMLRTANAAFLNGEAGLLREAAEEIE